MVRRFNLLAVRALVGGLVSGGVTALAVGVPTAVIPNPWFMRMTPIRDLDVLYLVVAALLSAGVGATYAFPQACPLRRGQLTAGGLLTLFAVGCPVCNKLVVLLLGLSGALTFFAPLQPLLGAVATVLLVATLVTRLRSVFAPPALAVARS